MIEREKVRKRRETEKRDKKDLGVQLLTCMHGSLMRAHVCVFQSFTWPSVSNFG